ncbi:MAG: NAD(+) synthase, partial [Muribaculaceae bacterium]|nr:NAD(+) synthase [Muribaculaceae bacterium]
PLVKPGDVVFNTEQIKEMVIEAAKRNVKKMAFPELSITGYTCADLFFQSNLIDKAHKALIELKNFSRGKEMVFIVGLPFVSKNILFNVAAVIADGSILGIVPKSALPNYNEFYERRWFSPGTKANPSLPLEDHGVCIDGEAIPFSTQLIFEIFDTRFGVEICEDLWVPVPPSSEMAKEGAEIIFNLSATNELAGKHAYLIDLIKQQSARCRCAYVYASSGLGESSTDLAFSGNAIIAENGVLLAESDRFSLQPQLEIADVDVELLRNDRIRHNTFNTAYSHRNLVVTDRRAPSNGENPDHADPNSYSDFLAYRYVNPAPFVEKDVEKLRQRCEEISSIQAWGLAQRLRAINCKNAVIGISGGLDSTLALLVTVKAFDILGLDRKGIIGITMPGFGTTERTHGNAWNLMEELGVTPMEIPINKAVEVHFSDIGQDPGKHDATYENSQARERTQILMDMANKTGGIVIGTGDLSELALGWCTYNGDQMSMYGVNASIPKTLVRDLVKGYMIGEKSQKVRETLQDIIDTPISPELLPAAKDGSIAQKTEDFVGPYELHDFFLHSMLRNSFSPSKIYALACKAFKGIYDKETIKKWLVTFYRRFFSQQFKRSCMPDGVKVGSVCLSPRGDWRMPSDASATLWVKEAENL